MSGGAPDEFAEFVNACPPSASLSQGVYFASRERGELRVWQQAH